MTGHPPTHKYRLQLTVYGNSHEEVHRELMAQADSGYLMDSGHESRDAWHITSRRSTRTMTHMNPDMTPERYARELVAWWSGRRAARHLAGQAPVPRLQDAIAAADDDEDRFLRGEAAEARASVAAERAVAGAVRPSAGPRPQITSPTVAPTHPRPSAGRTADNRKAQP